MAAIQSRSARSDRSVPADHRDLLVRPLVAALTTLLPDGQPQTQPVWFSYESPFVLINTMRGFRKERNLRADPRATLLVIDPANSSRWIEVRGLVQLSEDGAGAHLDQLAVRYGGVDRFFGGCVSAELAEHLVPVIGRINPIRFVDEGSANQMHSKRRSHHDAPRASHRRIELPASHLDLLRRPLIAILSTLMPDGHPQTQPVWFAFDGRDLSINSTRERQKGRNLERDPRATLLLVDPADSNRWLEVRADVECTEIDAREHLDRLTRAYTPWPAYYGYIHPVEQAAQESRVICRLIAHHVVCDAIFRARSAAVGENLFTLTV